MCVTGSHDQLVAILVTLFLVIPAKADVYLRPVPGWTVIQVYGLIKPADVRTFASKRGKRQSGRNPGYSQPAGAATSRLVSTLVCGFT